mgnify:CR=1 FL=1
MYIYACVFLGFVPILCAGAGYGLVKLQNRRRRRLKILQEAIQKRNDGKICVDKMIVREWLHANHRRLVKVKFGPEAALHIVDRKGEKLRTFDFNDVNTVTMEESQVIAAKFCTLLWKFQRRILIEKSRDETARLRNARVYGIEHYKGKR